MRCPLPRTGLEAENPQFLEESRGFPWQEQIGKQFQTELQFRSESPKRIVIDYSSPNIAKELQEGVVGSGWCSILGSLSQLEAL